MKITVKAHPKSKKTLVVKQGEAHYEVWVPAPPEKGRANRAIVEALSEYLGVSKTRLSMRLGETSKNKVFELG